MRILIMGIRLLLRRIKMEKITTHIKRTLVGIKYFFGYSEEDKLDTKLNEVMTIEDLQYLKKKLSSNHWVGFDNSRMNRLIEDKKRSKDNIIIEKFILGNSGDKVVVTED